MRSIQLRRPGRNLTLALVGLVLVTTAFIGVGLAGAGTQTALPCRNGGANCMNIGYTDAWLGGNTVQLEYSHKFFCERPPSSGASTECEAGAEAKTAPPSGAVVSEMYVLIPMGFTPPADTLQCPSAGHCIGQPSTIDMTRIPGLGGANATLPAHSIVIEEDESFQSTWWPLVLVGVNNLQAWNTIASEKSAEAMDACETSGDCTGEFDTNAYIFFQVLGPGMSPQGPD